MYVGGQGVNIAHFQEGENEEFFSKEELLCVFFSREDVDFYSRPSDLEEERLTNWEVWGDRIFHLSSYDRKPRIRVEII